MIDSALFYLMQITDSSFPIGAFAHSYGLETFTQQGIVYHEESSKLFVENMLKYNTLYNDASFLSWAYKYGEQNDINQVLLLDQEVSALKTASETRMASKKLAARFLKIIGILKIQNDVLSAYSEAVFSKRAEGHIAIVFGLYGHSAGISPADILTAYYYNSAAGMVTNCAKLIPLSQMAGQKILFNIQPLIKEIVLKTMKLRRDEVGRTTPEFDIKSIQHQYLYSRLYMS